MIGIDIVSIKRFEKFLEKQTALQKFLSDEEILLVNSSQSAAGFFAAKEAISKALGTGIGASCSFKDIKIHKSTQSAPYFTLSRDIVDTFHILDTSLSITHDAGFAIAVAVIETKNPHAKKLYH